MHLETLAFLVFTFTAPGVMQVPDTGTVTAIRAGRLIDPATGTIARNQIILVRGAKITAIGQDVPIPPGARVVDLSKQSVLPGLFDSHTHLCMTVRTRRDAGNYFYTTLNDPESARAVDGVVNDREMLRPGLPNV